jgi:hypothetical protein
LAGAHHGANIVLRENSLDRNDIGAVLIKPSNERCLEFEQSLL